VKHSWDAWQNPAVIPEIVKALGRPETVFGGKKPAWFPEDYTTVLDVGCGSGVFYPILTSNGARYIGVDSSQHMLAVSRERNPGVRFEHDDLLELDKPDKSFDLVWCNAVLIHIPVSLATSALGELRRVSKKYVMFNAFVGAKTVSFQCPRELGILQVWGEEEAGYMTRWAEVVDRSPTQIADMDCHTYRYKATL